MSFITGESNIILIGMPACGKSTVGVLLAKALGMGFMDTDLVIQLQRGMPLQKIIDGEGLESFLHAEEQALLSAAAARSSVIATGGSAVFSEAGMRALKSCGLCIYLETDEMELLRRLTNIKTRGIAARPGETIKQIYAKRMPLYQKYADITVRGGSSLEATVSVIYEKIAELSE